jgi:hypothetical protein
MREAYGRCEPFLSTVAQPTEQMTMIKEAKIEALKSIAKTVSHSTFNIIKRLNKNAWVHLFRAVDGR